MHFARKKALLFILSGIVIGSILLAPVCFSLCPPSQPGADLFQGANCSISYHSFLKINAELSVLFILPLFGFFLNMKIFSIPPGFVLSIFKPPRFVL